MKLRFIENILAMIGITLKGITPLFGLFPITQISIVFLFIIGILKRLFLFRNLSIQKTLFVTFISIFIISFIVNYNLFDFSSIKMFFGLIVYILAYYWYIDSYKNNLQKIIRLYIIIAILVAIIGLIQQIGYLFNFRYFYDSHFYGFGVTNITFSGNFLRVYSIMVEPVHLAMFLLPAVFLSILKFRRYSTLNMIIKRWEGLLIVICYLLTLSFVAYLSLFLMLIFIFLQSNISKIRKITLMVFSIIFFSSAIYSIPSISEKYVSIIHSSENKDFLTSTSAMSYFALLSNLQVSFSSLKENPFFGSGLNTHNLNYKKYIEGYYDDDDGYFELNSEDAGSLYIRLLSEFGIVGLMFFFYILIKFKVKTCLQVDSSFYIIINFMAFISILIITIRNGQYLNPMIIFLFSLLIITFKKEKDCQIK